jgi:hypothetical protein
MEFLVSNRLVHDHTQIEHVHNDMKVTVAEFSTFGNYPQDSKMLAHQTLPLQD